MAYDGHPNSGTRSLLRSTQSTSLSQEHLSESHTSDELTTSPALGTARTSASDDLFLEIADSSPSVQSIGSKDVSIAGDKKRNKLGYHRTAVACGHCRRRKIRCIPANDDESGRCQNCIRLKKECQFFPVDLAGQPLSKPPTPASKSEAANEPLMQTSRSPGHFGAPSTIQTKETDEAMLTGPFSLHGHLQSQWVAAADQSANFSIRQDMEYHQTLHHPQPLDYPVPSNSFDNQLNPYPPTHQQGSSGSFGQSPFGLIPGSGSITTSPEPGVFNFPQHNTGMEQLAWTPETASRSVSVADADELRSTNSGYHHADPYISMKRRMDELTDTAELQKVGMGRQHIKNSHSGVPGPYPDSTMFPPTLQQGMGWPMNMPPSVGHPGAVSEAHTQAWYPAHSSCQSKVHQEERSQLYQSHATPYQQFRSKPG